MCGRVSSVGVLLRALSGVRRENLQHCVPISTNLYGTEPPLAQELDRPLANGKRTCCVPGTEGCLTMTYDPGTSQIIHEHLSFHIGICPNLCLIN